MSERVLVVGAGISGCACAAKLAACGVPVTLVSSSLDVMGQPSFGAVVPVPAGDWRKVTQVLGELPAPLREVWLVSCLAPAVDEADGFGDFFCIDGRMLSIETKRALEQMQGIQLRQGLVRDFRIEGEAGLRRLVVAETAFGEVLTAKALVLAVGLGLGGTVTVGTWMQPGGRYGETPGEGLRAALESLGVKVTDTEVAVGPRLSFQAGVRLLREEQSSCSEGDKCDRVGRRVSLVPLGERLVEGGALGPAKWQRAVQWPREYPRALHWDDEARREVAQALVVLGRNGVGRCSNCESGYFDSSNSQSSNRKGEGAPMLTPDGIATGEWYADAEGLLEAKLAEGLESWCWQSRPGYTVSGGVVQGLTGAGRVVSGRGDLLPVWVTGRAAGACGYLESLSSGMQTAEEVAAQAGRLGLSLDASDPGVMRGRE
ncbi:MAG: FAD-dependent oxidoreductase [Thermoleophilia bacterium]|nr:FAD-dependent oxidoreductase [Thermoleophilia bacterium]